MFNPEPGEVHVWYASTDDVRYEGLRPLLNAKEQERASRYRFEKDSELYVLSHGLLRAVLSSYLETDAPGITFVYEKNGKPGLAGCAGGLRFSLSRSGSLTVIAVTHAREIGIDVERVDGTVKIDDIVKRFFSPDEASYLDALTESQKPEAFYRLWTRKEALLKATGEGLAGLCPDLDVLRGNNILRRDVAWTIYDLEIAPGYAVSLAVEGNGCNISTTAYFS